MLQADYQKNEQQFETCKLMREAIYGSIQDCDHWLKVFAAEEETARVAAEQQSKGLELVRGTGLTLEVGDMIAEAEEHEATREAAAG